MLPEYIKTEYVFEFAEWLGKEFFRLNNVWVSIHPRKIKQEYWKNTEDLYFFWLALKNKI